MLSNYEVRQSPIVSTYNFFSTVQKIVKSHYRVMSLFNVCFPGVQTPDRPEGTEEGQWEEQAQCWSAEPEHHHV